MSSLALAVVPFQSQRHEYDNEEEESESEKLQTTVTPFTLPHGWIVKKKPRQNVSGTYRHVDTYYYEPGTGKMFRSLKSVQKHVMGVTAETRIVKSRQVPIRTRVSASSSGLPDGWIVEAKPRPRGRVVDKTYIEPETGQRFRSLLAVQRYLGQDSGSTTIAKPLLTDGSEKQRAPGENCFAEAIGKDSDVAEKDDICPKSLKQDKSENHKESGSPKKTGLDKDNKASFADLSSPPAKVKWVLSGNGGSWTPFLDGSKVSEFVKQKWSDVFVSYIQDGGGNDS